MRSETTWEEESLPFRSTSLKLRSNGVLELSLKLRSNGVLELSLKLRSNGVLELSLKLRSNGVLELSLKPCSKGKIQMEKKKIFIVDDEKEQANLARLFLEKEGFEVIPCYDGMTAIDQAEKLGIDLVLLDINIPGTDGFQVCKALKSNVKTAGIPIIVYSARHDYGSCEKMMELGAASYLFKPYEREHLIKKVRKALEK
jgi:PleD family two-component response regulator